MSSCAIHAVLENLKGREFEVVGTYWGDGTIRVANPRPQKYASPFLFTSPADACTFDKKRLYWLESDGTVAALSPFRIKSMLLDAKQVRLLAQKKKR
jgi:hypothetical protein